MKLTRKSWVFPGQRCTRIDLSPVNYTFQVQAMSAEKLPFILPPSSPSAPSLTMLRASSSTPSLCPPIPPHPTTSPTSLGASLRARHAASMTMEEIFKGTKEFKQEVFNKIQVQLNQFGFIIYNANVKQLVDVPGHEYFSYLGQKVGSKLRDGQTKQNAAKIDAETKIISTQRQGEGKKQELKVETEVKIY
ncbi:hypothetical protein SASPL_136267 [Salvia splendens]|uniref:Flotillin-like n=1 Tax=Salvia splendens TaxID=180675 RepID=A0A8X8WZJ7_SALSN|nr:hypothetical protein SASPL_136267 [Salvia splendens]